MQRANGGTASDSARSATVAEFRTNRYDERSGTLRYSAGQAQAFEGLVGPTDASSPSRPRATARGPRRSQILATCAS